MKLSLAAPVLAVGLLAEGLALAQYGQATTPPPGYGSAPYGSTPAPGATATPGTAAPYGQQQTYGQPAATTPQIQAGGLAPPPSSSSDPESWRTEQSLETAEHEDSGRGLEWFYLNGEIGVMHLGLDTFKANGVVDANTVKTTQTGLLVGAGLGVRLVFLTIGPRFRLATFGDYQLWTLDAELGFRIPLGKLEPNFGLAGGYASVGSFSGSNVGFNSGDVNVRGYDIRAFGGFDYYVTPVFSVGVTAAFELIGLTRPGISLSKLQNTTAGTAQQNVYAADGSSIGAGISGTLVLGLHF
jgi:hypothetical protein